MQTIEIKDVENLNDGVSVPSVSGFVSNVYGRRSGTSEHGPWSFQDFTMSDKAGCIAKIKAVNIDDLSKYKGKTIRLECYKSPKHGLTGLKKLVENYQGTIYHKIKMSESAKIFVVNAVNGQTKEPDSATRPESHVEPDPEEIDPVTLARQALMRAVNAQYLIKKAVTSECDQSEIEGMTTTSENFGGQCGSLFRYLDQLGLVRQMPLKPIWSAASKPKDDANKEKENVATDW